MNREVRDLLHELKAQMWHPQFVFCSRVGVPISVHHIYRDFFQALVCAKLTRRVRFHYLCHSFASHFMMNGGNVYDLQKLLGHSNLEMTQRYAHLAPDHLARAINIVGFSGRESKVVRENCESPLKLVGD